ncbi:MAG TPA: CoA ester lyase [Burkholderiaceae bacterium]
MRSKLFVPGSRPELFDKALAGPADGLSFDLEDAVAEPRKAEARRAVGAMLERVGAQRRQLLVVRVNAIETGHFEADVDAVVRPGLAMINLPKPAGVEAVRAASAAIAAAERRAGVATPVGLLLNIETPRSLREAAALAGADPRVCGLQLGLGDLFEPIDIQRREQGAVAQAMFAVRMAAGEAGVPAWDSAFADFSDAEAFRQEASMARRFGFAGKSCIHPNQVALANEAFTPNAAEIAHALKVLEAADAAAGEGVGAWVVDGRMVDAPFVGRARATVALARALGLIPAGREGASR